MTASTKSSIDGMEEGGYQHHKAGLSPFVCACFTLNYIIGTGFLTLPWAFEEAGLVFSALTLLLACIVSNLASDYILSAMARADAGVVLRVFEGAAGTETEPLTNAQKGSKASYEQPTTIESQESSSSMAQDLVVEFDSAIVPPSFSGSHPEYYDQVKAHGKLLVGERKFELTELCQLFLGDVGLLAYGISSSLDLFGFLWAYSSVFGNSMAHLVPLGFEDDYPVWVFVFALIVIPLSMLHLSEQAVVQVLLSACRILMMVLMVVTPLWAAVDGSDEPHFGEQKDAEGAVLWDFGSFQMMFPAVIFSILFHQAVPGLADEMTDKRKVGEVFGYTYTLCFAAYCMLGIVGAWYFGDLIYSSANLNWYEYHGGTGTMVEDEHGQIKWVDVNIVAILIRFFVVSFPALDVVSAFPIYAYTLGNTLMGVVHSKNIGEVQRDRKVLTFYRCIAAIPPIIGSLFFRELGTITDYSGLVGLAIAFCFPPLLYIASEKRLKAYDGPYRTRYERFGKSSTIAMAMFWFGILTIVYCFILLTF